MILQAIDALNDQNGSNKSAISKYIESTYGDLPAGHTNLLSHHLNRMKESGDLLLVKNNYLRPGPDAPPKRGRGRPPKPKTTLPVDAVVSSPRPRGRPPKAPVAAAAAAAAKAAAGGLPRPRGRPPKKGGRPPADAPAVVGGVVKRGRGRPPKVKAPSPFAAVGFD
ncbi:hypothetical protein QJS04_geneDACA011873 [Acorus gramineus]|uniref:H15 domain-containing protein n=1 Tax=Acorus gramineus TaxID=55184 RepID=A0AAV9AIH8_ACOGR|nr:hypothetical protein QJS04_geneDACA011873 [Acorus gramineus]